MIPRPHVVYVLTSSLAARRMFAGYGPIWRAANLRVTIISSPGPDLGRFGIDEGVETVAVPNVKLGVITSPRSCRHFSTSISPEVQLDTATQCGTSSA